MTLGVTEKEFGIKVGSFLTVVGEVIYDFKNDSLRIKNPLELFISGKESFLKSYCERKLETFIFRKYFFIAMGIGTILLWGFYRFDKQFEKKKMNKKK